MRALLNEKQLKETLNTAQLVNLDKKIAAILEAFNEGVLTKAEATRKLEKFIAQELNKKNMVVHSGQAMNGTKPGLSWSK